MKKSLAKKTEFEIDVKSLKKGDVIPVESIEAMTGTKYGSLAYGFKCLSITSYLDGQLPDISIAIKKGNICLLTDTEAAYYQTDRFRQGMQTMKRSNRKFARIDTAEFDATQHEFYKNQHLIQSRILQAVSREMKAIK